MASVTAFTAARMKEIEDTTVVSGLVDSNGHLLLATRVGEEIDAGNVKGDPGTDAIISGVTAHTLPNASSATVDVSGTPTNRSFDFGIPKGDKGDVGSTGPQGDSSINAGTISLWGGDTAPLNWLLCDGAAYSRTTYAALFNAIGTKYGVGDGSTTFNVPNLKGRTPIGKDSAQTEFDNLGETGGSKSHSHALSANGQALIAMVSRTTNQIVMRRIASPSIAMTHAINTTNLGGGAASYTTAEPAGAQLAGSTDSMDTLPPYQVVNFIIKHSAGQTPSDSELAIRVGTLESEVSSNSLQVRETVRNLQRVLTGGGTRTVTATGFKWSTRFIALGAGHDAQIPGGYFDITMPPDGTVIPYLGHTTITSVTVSGGYITPPSAWAALYYIPPLGQTFTSVPANFRMVDYRADFTPPSNWILINVRNTDNLSPMWVWGDGQAQDYWRVFALSSWSDYGGEYIGHQWKYSDDGSIHIRGLIGGGTFSPTPVASWGATRAPQNRMIFYQPAVNGFARVDINGAGELLITSGIAGGVTTWVSLAGISWFPDGS